MVRQEINQAQRESELRLSSIELPSVLQIQLPEFAVIGQEDVNQIFTYAFRYFIQGIEKMNICDREILSDVEYLVTDYIERIEMQNEEIRNFNFDELNDNDIL